MTASRRASARLATLLTIVLAATGLVVSPPQAQASDTTAPVLTSLTLTSSATVSSPGTVAYNYAATEDSDSLAGVFVTYRDTRGRVSYVDLGEGLARSGSVDAQLTGGLPNGALTAVGAWVLDAAGNRTRYFRDASPTCSPACPPGVTPVDLTALDLTVEGSTEDLAISILTSASVPTPTVAVGEVARLDYAFTEEHPEGRLPSVETRAVFRSDFYHEIKLELRGRPDGSLSAVVPPTVGNGTYRLSYIELRDAVGNLSRYRSDGTVPRFPSSATGPTTHTLPLSSLTITVTGSSVDVTPPTFTSLTYPTTFLPSGGLGTLAYDATDDQAISAIDVYYTASHESMTPYGWILHAVPSATTPGIATGEVAKASEGAWYASSVTVHDQAGNWSRYHSSGGVQCNLPCPSTHSLDLSAMGATVVGPPTAGSAWATPRSQAARVEWTSFFADPLAPITGYTVTVSPGGQTYSVGASTRALTIKGLANDVRYSFAVRAKNSVGTGAAATAAAKPRKAIRLSGVNDTNNDGRTDVVGVTGSAAAYLYRGTGKGTIAYPGVKVAGGQYGIRSVLGNTLSPIGGTSVPVWAVTYDGYLRQYWTRNDGKWSIAWSHAASGLDRFRHVIAPGDFTGDGLPDLLAVNDSGELYLQKGRASGATPFYSRRLVNGGWGAFTHITGVADLNGDRRNDLLARKKDGTVWLYAGNGKGGFASSRMVATGWGIYHSFSGVGDFNRDGRADVVAVTPAGTLYLYTGNGKGGFTGRSKLGTGFTAFL